MIILYYILFIVIIFIYLKKNKIIEALGNGTYYITSDRSNRNCADEGNRIICNRGHVGSWEKYTIRNYGGRYAIIGGRGRRYCTDDGRRMKCDRGSWNSWERFKFYYVGNGRYAIKGGRKNRYCSDRGDYIRCAHKSGGRTSTTRFRITRTLSDAEIAARRAAERRAAEERARREAEERARREAARRAAEERARQERCRIQLSSLMSRLAQLKISLIKLERTKTFMGHNYYSNYNLDKLNKNVNNFNSEYNKLESNLMDLDKLNKTQFKALNEIIDLAPTKMNIGLRSQLINTDFNNLS